MLTVSILAAIGAIVVSAVAMLALALGLQIAGNVYGGVKGAYRLREIVAREGGKIMALLYQAYPRAARKLA